MSDVRLYVSNLTDLDALIALEFGRVDEGQPDEHWRMAGDSFGFLLDGAGGREVGFKITSFSEWDEDGLGVEEVWDGPRFHVPQLGLPDSTVGEIVLAVRALYGTTDSINRQLFNRAIDAMGDPQEALCYWLPCLQAGDCMAHYAIGYSLYELGRYREAYRHLRYYAEITPENPWSWCWLGRAAQAIGELGEARAAYERAIGLDDEETDADELLEALEDSV